MNPTPRAISDLPFGLLPCVARLSSDGTTVVDFHKGPVGSGLAITSNGTFAALGQALWSETANPGPSLLCVTYSASGQYSRTVVGVELITLYGVELGL
jgi:hypothetical protein